MSPTQEELADVRLGRRLKALGAPFPGQVRDTPPAEGLRGASPELADAAWLRLLAARAAGPRGLLQASPPPDWMRGAEAHVGRSVLLAGLRYPHDTFEELGQWWAFAGAPDPGFWFVELGPARAPFQALDDWLAAPSPWMKLDRALERWLGRRRGVDGAVTAAVALPERVHVLGLAARPQLLTAKDRDGDEASEADFGWCLQPTAIYAPGCALALLDEAHPEGAFTIGEPGWETPEALRPEAPLAEVVPPVEAMRTSLLGASPLRL